MATTFSTFRTQNDRGRSYKKAILKRKLLEIRKKHKKTNDRLKKSRELPLDKFNEQLFSLCAKYQQESVMSLKKMLMRQYYQKITKTNETKAANIKITEREPAEQKHLLDEIGHRKQIDVSDMEQVLLEKNLKKVATLGTVQLFNAINQCRTNYKKKASESAPITAPIPTSHDDDDNDNNPNEEAVSTEDKSIDDNKEKETTTTTHKNSLMHILRRRAKLSTENRIK